MSYLSNPSSSPSGGDPTIGNPVIGGDPNRVLYIDASGDLAQDGGFIRIPDEEFFATFETPFSGATGIFGTRIDFPSFFGVDADFVGIYEELGSTETLNGTLTADVGGDVFITSGLRYINPSEDLIFQSTIDDARDLGGGISYRLLMEDIDNDIFSGISMEPDRISVFSEDDDAEERTLVDFQPNQFYLYWRDNALDRNHGFAAVQGGAQIKGRTLSGDYLYQFPISNPSNNQILKYSTLLSRLDWADLAEAGIVVVPTNNLSSQLGTELSALTSGQDNIVVGRNSGASITTASDAVILGREAGENQTTAADNVIIGKQAWRGATGGNARRSVVIGSEAGGAYISSSNGGQVVFVGYRAGQGIRPTGTSANGVAIGNNTGSPSGNRNANFFTILGSGSGFNYNANHVVVIGHGIEVSSDNSAVIGDANSPLTNLYLGGSQNGFRPTSFTIQPSNATGTNTAGSEFKLSAGRGTGTGQPSSFRLSTPVSNVDSGTSAQIDSDRMIINGRYTSLVNNTLKGLFTVEVPTNSGANGTVPAVGGVIEVSVYATDGTERQLWTGVAALSALRVGSDTQVEVSPVTVETETLTSGTIAVTLDASDNGGGSGEFTFEITVDSSLTTTDIITQWQFRRNFGAGNVTILN